MAVMRGSRFSSVSEAIQRVLLSRGLLENFWIKSKGHNLRTIYVAIIRKICFLCSLIWILIVFLSRLILKFHLGTNYCTCYSKSIPFKNVFFINLVLPFANMGRFLALNTVSQSEVEKNEKNKKYQLRTYQILIKL